MRLKGNRLAVLGLTAVLASLPLVVRAVGTADADVTGAMDDLKATFDALKVPGFILLGVLLGIPILKKVVRKFT